MKTSLLPKNKFGVLGVSFTLIAIIIVALKMMGVVVFLPIFASVILGLFSFILLCISLFKFKDYSISSVFGLIVSSFILIWFILEVIFPH